MDFYVLPIHAAQALGIDPGSLDLPRCGLGISADALWIDPRFIEARRSRDAIARQMADHRLEIHIDRRPRMDPDMDLQQRRKMSRKLRLKRLRAAAASLI
jgi:hypothetical protein